jgi:hypothetical protein
MINQIFSPGPRLKRFAALFILVLAAGLSVSLPCQAQPQEEEEIIIEIDDSDSSSGADAEEDVIFSDEEFIFIEEDEEPEYPSRSLRYTPSFREWLGKARVGGYWENEGGVDTVQDNKDEDKIDFRSKIFGYGTYTFTENTSVYVSILAYYWILEGANDRQQATFNIYEGYLKYATREAEFKIGQQAVKWGACNLLSPTNVLNPVNYQVFINPDSEDLRIALPMAKLDLFFEPFTLELVYIPIYQSSILEVEGSDLSLVQARDLRADNNDTPFGLDTGLRGQLTDFVDKNIDFREERFVTGDIGVNFGWREGGSQLNLIFFSGREDIPLIRYQATDELDPIARPGSLDFEFPYYALYGASYKLHHENFDFLIEYAYAPVRKVAKIIENDIPPDDIADRTRREKLAWQSAAVEIDYLADGGKYFIKVGAQKTNYFGASEDNLFASPETLYFLLFYRYYALERTLWPELRVINIQNEGNFWFISPRIGYKFLDRYEITAGMNLFTGSGQLASTSNQDFMPIVIISENNQAFISVRWSF